MPAPKSSGIVKVPGRRRSGEDCRWKGRKTPQDSLGLLKGLMRRRISSEDHSHPIVRICTASQRGKVPWRLEHVNRNTRETVKRLLKERPLGEPSNFKFPFLQATMEVSSVHCPGFRMPRSISSVTAYEKLQNLCMDGVRRAEQARNKPLRPLQTSQEAVVFGLWQWKLS